jgi:uncharacterized protein YgbK (DUF1537 family)
VAVVDLGTRHLSPADARARVAQLSARGGGVAHKVDSTLRGNWPDEIAARAAARPVLLVPALPDLGRVCVEGVVLAHGRPVHEGAAGTDVRRRVTTSRPADSLRAAGVAEVVELGDVDAVTRWLDDPGGVAVADATDTATIGALVGAWLPYAGDVVLAGTSAVIGAIAPGGGPAVRLPSFAGPVLVVCGSVHPATRAQLAVAERHGIPVATIADDVTARQLVEAGALVLATEIPVGDVDEPMAVAAAANLAAGVERLRRTVGVGALIVIGGDTAASLLGTAPVSVSGTFGAGAAWALVDGFEGPVITRSGGFGGERALVELIRGTLEP